MASLKKNVFNKRLMTDYITSSPTVDENAQAVQRVKGGLKKDQTKVTEPGRVSLRVLQPSSNNQGLTRPETEHDKPLVSRKRKLDDDVINSPCKRVRAKPHKPDVPVKVFEDTPQPEAKVEVETQTEGATGGTCSCNCHQKDSEQKSVDQEAYELMCSDTVPEGYWKALAEERRAALADSLEENCELHGRLQEQLQEIERLTELANQAEYFASLLRAATEDSDDEEDEEAAADEQTEESSAGPSTSVTEDQSSSPEPSDSDTPDDS